MFSIIVVAVVVFILYNVFKGKNEVLNDAATSARTFREGLEPIKEQIVQASNQAKASYEAAQHERRVDQLLNDPELLADVLEARKNKISAPE